MSSLFTSSVQSQTFASRFLNQIGFEGERAGDLNEGQIAARDEINALQETINNDVLPIEDDAPLPRGDILGFINDQFSGENSDTAVAFLLDLAARQFIAADDPNLSLEDRVAAFQENGETPTDLSLTAVLDLALETNQQIRKSNAPIGLQLSILAELQAGLQDIGAEA